MIDLELLRQQIADSLERHIAPHFRPVMKINLIAVHPDNPDAHVFVGQSGVEEVVTALKVFAPARRGGRHQRVLDYLREHGEVSQADLARALQMSTARVRETIRFLVEEGEVLRRSDQRGRSSWVRLRGEP